MFRPKKTIPKLALGALALTGCGDAGGADAAKLVPCITQKASPSGDFYDYGDYNYGDPDLAYGFNFPSYADGCIPVGYGEGGYGQGYAGYGEGSDGGGAGLVLPDNDPNPTNDSFQPGGDSFYNGG